MDKMKVLIGGKESERPVCRIEDGQKIPVLNRGEEINWVWGDDTPRIIKLSDDGR